MNWTIRPALSIPSLVAARPRFRSDIVRGLEELFSAMIDEAGGTIPPRAALDPARMPSLLPHAILYQFDESGDLIFRVVGENLVARFGFNPKDRPYTIFVHPDRRETAMQAFRVCAEHRCAMHLDIVQRFRTGRTVDCDVLGVPLAAEAGAAHVSHLLFVDCVVGSTTRYVPPDDGMTFLQVRERAFIDLGFGTPPGFEDRIQDWGD